MTNSQKEIIDRLNEVALSANIKLSWHLYNNLPFYYCCLPDNITVYVRQNGEMFAQSPRGNRVEVSLSRVVLYFKNKKLAAFK